MPQPISAASEAIEEYAERRRQREMRRALEADGKKLRQLTGEDHGPEFFVMCHTCQGSGDVATGRMSHEVNTATIDPPWEIMEPCKACGGSGWILEE